MLVHSARRRLALLALAAAALISAGPVLAEHSVSDAWTVTSTRLIEREPLAFTSAGTRLSGTLVYPKGGQRMPAVIVLHGASVGRRDAPLYRHLQEMLPPLGVAVLIFDRRGEGDSGGTHDTHGFDELARDGVAAFASLARDQRIDAKRIGFWGLSQGGWLALLAAVQEPRAAFVIAASAPIVTADVQMNFAVSNLLRVQGYSQNDIDAAVGARTAVDNFARGLTDRATAVAAEAAVANKLWYRSIFLKGNIDDPGWIKQISSDPVVALEQSKVPTLIVYGQRDPWVPVDVSLATLQKFSTRHPNVTTVVIDGADHMMMLGVDPVVQMDAKAAPSEAPNAPAYFSAIATWLAQRGLTSVSTRKADGN